MVKALFIYGGIDREELEKKVTQGIDPDTSFFGFNYVKKDSRIQADYLQIKKSSYKIAGWLVRKYVFLNTVYLLFALYRRIGRYDVILLTSSAYFNLLFLKKLGFFRRQRWILFNLDLTTLLEKNKKEPFYYKLLLWTTKAADKIICISKTQVTCLKEAAIPQERLVFIPLGVDNHFYKMLPHGEDFILTVGRDIGRDFTTFLEAMKLLDERVVIICSPKNMEGLLDKVPANVTILYDRPYQELRSYYEKAKCFVISTKPATYLVGSDCPGQTAILDSMAYGRAVIATYNPWFEGYFEERQHIVTVPPEDPVALSKAVKEVMTNTELRERMVIEARKLIDTECNSELMAKRISEIISSV